MAGAATRESDSRRPHLSRRRFPAVARRSRGTGSTWQRDDGRWVAQVGYRGPDGKRKYLTRVVATSSAAKAKVESLRGRVAADRTLVEAADTLDRYLADWLERIAGSVSPATLRSYEGHVRMHIAPLLGGIAVEDLRPVDVDRLVRDRGRDGLSPATVERIVTTLSMALEQLVREGVLARNVAKLARRPKVDRASHIRALTPAEAQNILELVAGDPLEALYALLLGSGLRLGEAIALDWRDVDLERGVVAVRAGKTARARRLVKIAPFAASALRAHRARSAIVGAGEPVFRGIRRGERLRADAAYAHWMRLRADAGLPAMRIHDLRHGHASLLLARGTPMRLIADQLGHANPALTARVYAHVLDSQLEAAVEGLGELVKGRLTS
jgi:integrase